MPKRKPAIHKRDEGAPTYHGMYRAVCFLGCGWVHKDRTTDDDDKVTCKNCRRLMVKHKPVIHLRGMASLIYLGRYTTRCNLDGCAPKRRTVLTRRYATCKNCRRLKAKRSK